MRLTGQGMESNGLGVCGASPEAHVLRLALQCSSAGAVGNFKRWFPGVATDPWGRCPQQGVRCDSDAWVSSPERLVFRLEGAPPCLSHPLTVS